MAIYQADDDCALVHPTVPRATADHRKGEVLVARKGGGNYGSYMPLADTDDVVRNMQRLQGLWLG